MRTGILFIFAAIVAVRATVAALGVSQHTATDCNRLQQTATDCNRLQQIATDCNTRQHTATHGNTRQHTATHCNTTVAALGVLRFLRVRMDSVNELRWCMGKGG